MPTRIAEAGGASRRASKADVRRGVPPVHAAHLRWVIALSTSTSLLSISALNATWYGPRSEERRSR